METATLYQYFKKHPTISTDTRKIKSGSLFFALKGANFNGNAFAEEALNAGAAYAIIDEVAYQKDERYLLVNDVLYSLQSLATHHRRQLNIPVIGITGSNGKTTTKELIASVLQQHYRTYATKGNLNNHIGVPLSLLEINDQIDIAIIEMGANHPKEIELLCTVAQPTHGLITNVGRAHLEGFGGFIGVKTSKAELYEYLALHDGVLFLQADNTDLIEMKASKTFKKVTTYGFFEENDISGRVAEHDPYLYVQWSVKDTEHEAKTQISGSYNLENILAAICVGIHFDLEPEQINLGLTNYQPTNNRSQVLKTKKNTVICDFYNANASSMEAALENFTSLKASSHKVLILGDMFELGEASEEEHRNIINKAMFVKTDLCVFIGSKFYEHQREVEGVLFFKETRIFLDYLKEKPFHNSLILLKASRGMAFENLLPNL